jgi:hypothetical protein
MLWDMSLWFPKQERTTWFTLDVPFTCHGTYYCSVFEQGYNEKSKHHQQSPLFRIFISAVKNTLACISILTKGLQYHPTLLNRTPVRRHRLAAKSLPAQSFVFNSDSALRPQQRTHHMLVLCSAYLHKRAVVQRYVAQCTSKAIS